MPKFRHDLTDKQKAAVLLITLGSEVAAKVYQHLPDNEVEQLTSEISSLQYVNAERRDRVLKEFHDIVMANEYISNGGEGFARDVLKRALGPEEAERIANKVLRRNSPVRRFRGIREADPERLADLLREEQPQTTALVLSHLDAKEASRVLSALPSDMQPHVIRRIALMSSAAEDVISSVEDVLENRFMEVSYRPKDKQMRAGGIHAAIAILNSVDDSAGRNLLSKLAELDPVLGSTMKQNMWTLEDVVLLDDRSIQRILQELPESELLLALRTAERPVQERIFATLPKSKVRRLQRQLEITTTVRLRDIEAAQQRIVDIAVGLETTNGDFRS